MAIGSFIFQPASNSINAAYRPVALRVNATATNGDPVPPVVYCDIYFNGSFYKSLSRTQYNTVQGSQSEWEFDIQDAAQEFLASYLAQKAGDEVELASSITVEAYCKFRSSGIDADGYTVAEGTAPVQGTWGTSPSAGTGTQSNTFIIVMATLQHDEDQDLATHLNKFKNGSWSGTTFPLSHRPNHYRVCSGDSDFFPILSEGEPGEIEIHYTNNDGTTGTGATTPDTGGGSGGGDDDEPGCVGVGGGTPSFPTARSGTAYNYSFGLTGTAPFTLNSFSGPSWMSAAIVGNAVQFTGTPADGDLDTDVEVLFTVSNCSASTKDFVGEIDIVASDNFVLSSSYLLSLRTAGTDGSGAPALGPTGLNTNLKTHHIGISGTVEVIVTGTPPLTVSMQATINASPVGCLSIPGPGTYEFDIEADESDVVAFSVFSGTCPP